MGNLAPTQGKFKVLKIKRYFRVVGCSYNLLNFVKQMLSWGTTQ